MQLNKDLKKFFIFVGRKRSQEVCFVQAMEGTDIRSISVRNNYYSGNQIRQVQHLTHRRAPRSAFTRTGVGILACRFNKQRMAHVLPKPTSVA